VELVATADAGVGVRALESLLPKGCAAVAQRGDLAAPLLPEERPAIAKAVAGRRREFTTGRACAREALARLGLPGAAVPAGADGDPRWPPGIVGSITHCERFRAAVVARRAEVAGVGIDAEPNAGLTAGVFEAISLPEERAHLRRCADEAPGVSWERLLFSAKEAVFKVWFPLTRRRLGFEEASVAFDLERRSFSARVGAGSLEWRGRWLLHDGLLLTAIALTDAPSLP
jgi:enterobactin synthetase component D / holo-[acyl-carrier protein] synthase